MNVAELIVLLNKVGDKTLPIRILKDNEQDDGNYFLYKIELSETGESGYEIEGELRMIGGE